ncbi:MAG: transposase [Sphaerochaetaceae bacterium]|nr:transposase [Sphaerochaetaceae bacterium]
MARPRPLRCIITVTTCTQYGKEVLGTARLQEARRYKSAAERLRERIDWLANHARHGISTSKLEGFNNRIKVAKLIGYGYRDDDYLFTTIRYISIPDLGSLSPKKT